MLNSMLSIPVVLNLTAATALLLVSACSSSSSATSEEQGLPISDQSQLIIDQIANDASLGGSVLKVRSLVVDGTLAVVSNLNNAYTQGVLSESRIDCLDLNAGFPVLEYYCGEDGVGERLSDLGYPVFAFTILDTSECRNSILGNELPASCAVVFSDAEIAGEWYLKYTSTNSIGTETLTLSNGVVPGFVDIDLAGTVCEITITDLNSFEFNDQSICRSSVAQVLSILQAP